MLVMAIRTLDQAFIDAVMEWFGERRFHFHVASKAKIGSGLLEQCVRDFGGMHGVTIRASDIAAMMGGALKVRLVGRLLMAIQAVRGRLYAIFIREGDDVVFTGSLGVGLARPVTAFATLERNAAA